jgi:hypothetical protein
MRARKTPAKFFTDSDAARLDSRRMSFEFEMPAECRISVFARRTKTELFKSNCPEAENPVGLASE